MDNIIDLLKKRKFIDATTSDELREITKKPIKLYAGFDPTAKSLHLGNLVGIIALHWFQKLGHTPVVLVGGATGKIGDPSGKSVERPLLSHETLKENVEAIKNQMERFLDFSHPTAKPVILNNDDWYGQFSVTEFLRDIGKHFRMSTMLAKDSVKSRLTSEEGMSYTEFSYQILQGYDFYYLNKNHGVSLQLGGSDQWGNITAGIEFSRKVGQLSLYGMTFPLLTRSDGKKFGKSEGGAIWLCPNMCSPYRFFQYLFRVPDADIGNLLRMLTFIPLEEIEEIEQSILEKSHKPNAAQLLLAEEVTRYVHGEVGLEKARKVTQALLPGSNAVLDPEILHEVKGDMPSTTLKKEDISGKKLVDVFVLSNLLSSKSEATRLIKNGGAYLNNEKVEDVSFCLSEENLIGGEFILVSAGKKKRLLIEVL